MAAELVGSAVLSSFLQVAFDRLASREILHYFRKRGVNETLVKELKIMLISINSVIDDAEDKQFSDSNVKAWLLELKDAVYDAEDVLDELNYQLYKHKMEAEAESQTGVFVKVRKFFNASATSSFDEDIESRMKQVLENLEFLESRKIDLGLKQGKGGPVGLANKKLPTTSLVDEVIGVYGRNEDKDIIIKGLLKDSHFSVMSIVGMGGLGKTTLAQLVYNDPMIQSEFDLRVWVCVSDDFDVLRLTKTIFNKIMSSNDDTEDLDILQNNLKDELSRKKFLIVLDDVWCDDYKSWEALRAPFSRVVAGSRILVTSRHEKVALAAHSDENYHPHQLSDEDSWLLFTKSAFDSGCPQMNFDLEEIGRGIVKKCNGLPLALKSIGSLLYKKSSWEEWNNVLTSELWNIPDNNILPALILSYHYLPSHLKCCFAYCSLFPKDYEFDKEELVLLWMAQDFLRFSQPNKSIKEVGNECFLELVSRSFLQKSSVDDSCFVMHDILNDLAVFVSGEFCFKQEVKGVQQISEKTRHFCFLIHEDEEFRQFEYLQEIRKLQTFLRLSSFLSWTSSGLLFDQLSECKCLRVLTLAGNVKIMEIPDSIRNLVHLRYLDLSFCEIKRLPESICLLYNLQTLKLANCGDLDELPAGLHKLKNLCHLDLEDTSLKRIPPNLGELKNLQVRLTSFDVGKCGDLNIKQLGELNLLGVQLTISELQNVVDGMDALKASLKEKKSLEKLHLRWNGNSNDEDSQKERDVLEKLQPHRNLKELSVRYYGGTRFPDWFADNTVLSNIVSLQLISCKYCFLLPSLGLLSSLKSLYIEGLDGIVAIGAEFLGSDSCGVAFGSLETLTLTGMLNWEEWDCTNASRAFPRLKELRIRNCPKLKENLPPQLPSLEELVIEDCPQLVGSVLRAPVIQRLTLSNLVSLPECINILAPSLNSLVIEDCPQMESFPEGGLPSKLEHLHMIKCPKLIASRMRWGLHNYGSLRSFTIADDEVAECLPEAGLLPTSLIYLYIYRCRNLRMLNYNALSQLPSLQHLDIIDCPRLQCLPEEGLPTSLIFLRISGDCEELKQRCQKLKGQDWPKIAHIPHVYIN